jgi:hypothetical protein
MKLTRRILLAAPGALLLPASTRADQQRLAAALREFTSGQPMREGLKSRRLSKTAMRCRFWLRWNHP